MQARREITSEIIADAGAVAGLDFTDAEREMMLAGLNTNLEAYEALREVSVSNHVPPAVQFDPALPGRDLPSQTRPFLFTRHIGLQRPADPETLAFMPVTQLAELIRTRQLSSTELTTLYLERLERHGPTLEAVITLMSDRALEHAARADREVASGTYRGPLHGIPWGAKDLLAAEGFRTTWGATPYEDQVIGEDATVVRRLEEAGAILVAKLTLGALARGDYWYGGQTRNPWNLEQGSSGSSAGSAATTAAGLVGFAIGSETLGSIVSPSTRCGVTGLRPTYGRGQPVRRHGPLMEHGQAGSYSPRGGGLCTRVQRHSRGGMARIPRRARRPSTGTPSGRCRISGSGTSAAASKRSARPATTGRRSRRSARSESSRCRSTFPPAIPSVR